MFVHQRRRGGMTLIELTAGVVVMSVLSAALMSSMLIASHALPEQKPAEERAVAATEALERIASDLTFATEITTLTNREIIFTVADRGEGAAGPETVRYVWNGTPGGALLRVQNAGAADILVDRVTSFVITARPAMRPITGSPRVLLVVANETTMTANDTARKALLTGWGHSVQLMSDDRVSTDLSAAVPSADVVYLSGDIANLVALGMPDPRIGVVIENCSANTLLGVSTICATENGAPMVVYDNQTEILSPFALGASVQLTTASQSLANATGLGSGVQVLGRTSTGANLLMVLELGGQLATGVSAKARRVRLPWGRDDGTSFPFPQLTSNSQTILRRSLAWSSATPVVAGLNLSVQPDDPGAAVVETEVSVLNQPRDPRP
jgi:type II secretory pathway pseudopilin PulG